LKAIPTVTVSRDRRRIRLRLEQHADFDSLAREGDRELDRRVVVADVRHPFGFLNPRSVAPWTDE
jgi:hypothetical protein